MLDFNQETEGTNPLKISNLNIKSGWICGMNCPASEHANPFIGSVDFSNSKIPTSQNRSKLVSDSQQYRNLRGHFEKLGNTRVSGLMRAKELAIDRETEVGTPNLFNWIYYLASGYGFKPGKSLLWIILFYIITVGMNVFWDGGETRVSPNKLDGWEVTLGNKYSFYSKLERSCILPLQSMFNPVGAFRSNQILVPKKGFVKFLLIAYGFISDGLLLFFIFGLRKRFKLH